MPEELNSESMAAEVASSLGFGGGENPPVDAPPVPPAADAEVSAAPAVSPPVPPAANLRPLPKSWKKDMEAHWGSLPPEVHDYVYEREGQVSRGISQYKGGHDAWTQLTGPYQGLLSQYPDVNPVQLFNNLLQNHLAMLQGSPEQRRALAQKLLQEYGVDLDGVPPQAQVPQEFLQRFNTLEQTFYQQSVAQQRKLVEQFFSDPKNEFAEELQDDILQLVKTGQAGDLQSAYEKAMWLNPAVRQKLIDKQLKSQQEVGEQEAETAQKLARLNGKRPDVPGKPAKSVPQNIDDTINSVIAKYHTTH